MGTKSASVPGQEHGVQPSNPVPVFVTVTLLTLFAVVVCLLALRATLNVLGLDLMRTLVWLGVAEFRTPPVSRRRGPVRIDWEA